MPEQAAPEGVFSQPPERGYGPQSMSHADFRKVLRRAGYSTTQAGSVLRGLPDPIDFERSGEALLRQGISLGRLTDQAGGSP
jgi:hypothetical protein